MVEVIKYSAEHKAAWDAFVDASKNGTFMFRRDYMEYHADRFRDHSLLFYKKDKLIGFLPSNETGEEIHSHGGLSYGGIISGEKMTAAVMLDVFEAMRLYFKQLGFQRLKYKVIPSIYHQIPAEEDLYALFRSEAILYRRDVSSVIDMQSQLLYTMLRNRMIKQAQRFSLDIRRSENYASFMELERQLLQEKYNTQPTHTAEEITSLASFFPSNIKLYTVCEATEIIAGIVVYEAATVAHCQYISTTARGREVGALDVLVDHLLTREYAHKKYFSFGISTEQQGRYLNKNLIQNKESFGARAIVHDFYELKL
ncbi:GNAT family N-acetyltransferase [Pontibacter harenae]|uniref:GNAT family N-acetyltransferase n=1 Tax=Pontibacter harenae TaxID=2894083 RepID=UPI001E2FCB1B|nr:GNAT family N-acetyltransferase [Pontibacter harenae]MCC9165271.1 GNAT family N-acetyltransferase [Pontibacter harenae]